MSPIKRPAIRYYGSKWRISKWIISHFPKHRVFVDLFGGSAAIILNKTPCRTEIYNDLNDELTNFFQVLRSPKKNKELRRLLDLTPYSRTEFERCRTAKRGSRVEKARWLVVLTFFAHHPAKSMNRERNGFRSTSNQHQDMATSFRTYVENLEAIGERFRDIIIENRDAIKLIYQHWYPDAVIYADPPYIGKTRKDNKALYKHEMRTPQEHYKMLFHLHGHPGFVFVSSYDHWVYDQLEWWGWVRVAKSARDGGTAQRGSNKTVEALWMNPRAAAHQKQLKIF